MTGNTFGKIFRVTTFGESHGDAIGCVIDGCPSGMSLNQEDIQIELERRKPGKNRYVSQRREKDEVKIISGVFQGKTTGAPITLIIENYDQRESDYEDLANVYRPGHADFSYHKKYGHYDYRGGGRASARETAMRVAAGAIAKKYLKEKENILVHGYLAQMGALKILEVDWHEVENNAFFCPDKKMISQFEEYIQTLLKQGDSIGAKIYVEALNVPAGLGEPVYDKLDAEIAKAMMSINAVKAVEIGSGFDCVTQNGSEHRDEITPEGFLTNHAGGILGGISTGQTIYANVAFKPTSSIRIPAKTITKNGDATEVSVTGRHDPCVGIRATPIVEAMLALVLMDNYLLMRARK